jgi:hypothetical protein
MKAEEIREILYNIPFDKSKFGSYENHIRDEYKFHVRFDMSGLGFESIKVNQNILLLFAEYGLFEGFDILHLGFYKGIVTLHYRYDLRDLNNNFIHEINLSGYTTCEIIAEIFKINRFF